MTTEGLIFLPHTLIPYTSTPAKRGGCSCESESQVKTSQAIKHKCYFPKENGRFNHHLHTENAQLNTIIDLQISQAESLREFNQICTDLWKTVHSEMVTKNILLRQIHENQEYIKNQYTYLVNTVREIERSLLIQQKLVTELREILIKLQRQSNIFDAQTTKTAILLEKLQKNSEEW